MALRDEAFSSIKSDLRALADELKQRESEAEIDASEDELDALHEIRDQHASMVKQLTEADRRDDEGFWESMKKDIQGSHRGLKERMRLYRDQAGARRRIYAREREANLREIGAQIDEVDAKQSKDVADTKMLTRAEITALRQQLAAARDAMKRLVRAEGAPDWAKVRDEYESSWRELQAKAEFLNQAQLSGRIPTH